jgi:HK97 family phage major capsid protein
MTLFELKEKLATLNNAIKADADWIAEKAADPTVPMDEIKAKTAHRDELTQRRDLLKSQHDEMETAQRKALEDRRKAQPNTGDPDKDAAIKTKAAYYRAIALGDREAAKKVYAGLGGIPATDADYGSGSYLLPTNVSSEIISEPAVENSLRRVERTSQIAGLEEPRIAFDIDDEDLLTDVVDFETAKEIEAATDMVTYGRYKTKVRIKVADTVVYGSDTNLVTEVEKALRSALARKEKLRALGTSVGTAEHKHMSFYLNGVKAVTGTSVVAAIMAALGDLSDIFRANASVVMKASDWYTYVQTLTNTSGMLFDAKPEAVLGVPVVFNDQATYPIVGDFSYARQNYDPTAILDSDKDVDTGTFKYVLTAWGDHQIRLKSAFRIAVISVVPTGGFVPDSAVEGGTLTVTPLFTGDTVPNSGITYEWQINTAGGWAATTGWTNDDTATVTIAAESAAAKLRCKITYGGVSAYSNAVTIAAAD